MSLSQISIRPPVSGDRAQWDGLWQAYLEFYQSRLAPEVTELLWRRINDPAEDIQCRVAVRDASELVGLVHFFPHAHTWYAEPVVYLNDLYVKPELRGAGTGESLISAVVDYARQQGWPEVYWHTQAENRVARGLYDKITGGTDGFINYSIDLTRPE